MQLVKTVRTVGLMLPAGLLLAYGAIQLNARPVPPPGDRAVIGKQSEGIYFVPTGQTIAPAGKNLPFDYTIVLSPTDGGADLRSFNDPLFFPLDGKGWNDAYTAEDNNPHNFSFAGPSAVLPRCGRCSRA